MTIKLFKNNSLLKQCVAKVTACTPKDGKYLVELDQTVFFPEGGGQLSDRGKLADAVVSHVSEKDGHIYHECDKPLEVGAEVEAGLVCASGQNAAAFGRASFVLRLLEAV